MNALRKYTHFDMNELPVITFAFIYFFSCCLVKPENKFQCAKQVRGIYVWYLMCENYDHFTCSMKWLGFNFIHINLNCIASNSGQLVIFLRFLLFLYLNMWMYWYLLTGREGVCECFTSSVTELPPEAARGECVLPHAHYCPLFRALHWGELNL